MQFLYPVVLYMMLIPIVVLIFLLATNKSLFEQSFDKQTISKLSISNKNLTKETRNTLLFISLFLFVLALARPVMDEKEKTVEQSILPLVIGLDISKSMLAQDVYPNRIEMAKNKINFLLENKHFALGFISFAQDAYILSPITQDMNSFKYILDNFNYEVNFNQASNVMAFLEASNKLLKSFNNKSVLLFTDGGNKEDYSKEIEYANKHNIKVYTLAVATKNSSPIPTKNGFLTNDKGEIVTVKLNENIKDLSLNTNAAYINYSLSQKDIDTLSKDIKTTIKEEKVKSQKFKVYTELFYYPLGIGLIFLFLAFFSMPKIKLKKTNKLMLFFATTLLVNLNTNLKASVLNFKTLEEAKEAYENKDFKSSSNKYKEFIDKPEGKYNFANSLYKEKKYKSALNMFKDISTADDKLRFKKLHNMGNTYVKLNDLQNAKKMYEKALKIKYDEETKKNLDMVNEALNKNQKQNNKQNDKSSKNNKQKENQENNQKKKNESSKKQESKTKQDKSTKQNKPVEKENEISNLEEKKWLDSLNKKDTPILMKKFDAKNKEDNSNNKLSPW